jgi:uncharacterized protein YgiM (DUF1202 family)
VRLLPANIKQLGRRPSPRLAWMATIAVVTVLTVLAVYAARSQQAKSTARQQELERLRSGAPARETVYAHSVTVPPTLVTTSQSDGEVSGLDVPFRALAVNTVLRSGPGDEYAIVKQAVAGERVRVLTLPLEIRGQRWQRVRTDDGQVGWCRVNELAAVGAGE